MSMEPADAMHRRGRRPRAFLRLAIRSMDGSSEPEARLEFNCTQASMIVFHLSPAIPRSMTPTGSVVVYLLREQLSRSPPPTRSRAPRTLSTPAEYDRYTQQARSIFYKSFESMVWVESVLGSARIPEAWHLFWGEIAREISSCAARNIVRCLRLLQTKTRPAQTMCLRCNRPPVVARGPADENTHILEVRSNHACRTGGFTTIDSVSVLPPLREFDPPMLCEMHQYEFQFYMYQVVNPRWPVPYLLEDIKIFGPIRLPRWSSTTNTFEYEEESP